MKRADPTIHPLRPVPDLVIDILVIGASGLLGQNLLAEAKVRGFNSQGTYSGSALDGLSHLDLSNLAGIVRFLERTAPANVFLAAAMTDVDGCEADRMLAEALNAVAPGEVARTCRSMGARLVYFSTDYVFSGAGPFDEASESTPLNVYGRTKLGGEHNVRQLYPSTLILRTSANFGWNRTRQKPNAVTWILDRLRRNEEVPLFADQWVSPSYVHDVARAALDLLERDSSGLFHVASRDCLTRFEMGRAVCEVFGLSESLLRPVKLEELNLRAPRPHHSCLTVSKVERTLNTRMGTFRDGLVHMRDHE